MSVLATFNSHVAGIDANMIEVDTVASGGTIAFDLTTSNFVQFLVSLLLGTFGTWNDVAAAINADATISAVITAVGTASSTANVSSNFLAGGTAGGGLGVFAFGAGAPAPPVPPIIRIRQIVPGVIVILPDQDVHCCEGLQKKCEEIDPSDYQG